jgi:hypothetical protein
MLLNNFFAEFFIDVALAALMVFVDLGNLSSFRFVSAHSEPGSA